MISARIEENENTDPVHESNNIELIGIIDLSYSDMVVEIKYTNSSDNGIQQLGCYSAITGKPGVLVNLKLGEMIYINIPDSGEMKLNTRAFIGITYAMSKYNEYKRLRYPELDGATLIAFDTEYDPCSGNSLIETGLVAWRAGTTTIDKTLFSSVALPDRKTNDASVEKNMYGLEIGTAKEAERVRFETVECIKNISGRKIFLVWGGNDLSVIGLDPNDYDVIDVYTVYGEWLKLNSIHRKGKRTLSDVVECMLSADFPFGKHRAFEDALGHLLGD